MPVEPTESSVVAAAADELAVDLTAARALIFAQLAQFLAVDEPERAQVHRERMRRVIDDATDAELRLLLEHLTATGSGWAYQAADPLARRLNRALGQFVLRPGSVLQGTEQLAVAQGGPITFVGNHLSFADANVFECLLGSAGREEIASRLTVLAGPKVFTEPLRRLMSLCFGAIKTPQSSSLATGEAVMSRREVAAAAASTLQAFEARRAAGDHLLIFVEGSRSRSATMQNALPAVSRYIEKPGVTLIPFAITGSERLVPIGDDRVHPAHVTVRLGPPFAAQRLWELASSKRRLVMDTIGLRIASLLPPSYRGVYADDAPGFEDARAIASRI